jgi:hypothetical protein
MADENEDTPTPATPAPRRRAARKNDAMPKPSAAKRASRPATTTAKKPAASRPDKPAKRTPATRSDRAKASLTKATDAVGGKWGAAAIAGGLAAAGAAAALLTLRSSSPKAKPTSPVEPGTGAHQPDGTDSSGQMDAMIADESMIPDKVPGA